MKKKILFIDRDGTIISEPEDEQVDSLEKLEFMPGVFRNLYKISNMLDFIMVMVSNQDGLGTAGYPEEAFELVQGKLLQTLSNEGINFDSVHINRSFQYENSPSRKPGTAMLTSYLNGDFDIENSWVIGDRMTDAELAANLGCRAVLIGDSALEEQVMLAGFTDLCSLITGHWDDVFEFLKGYDRIVSVSRKTSETDVYVRLNPDGKGLYSIKTGVGFFDHLLEQFAKHAGIDLEVRATGDIHVDEHHTVEDVAIVMGDAFYEALGSKKGITRYGFVLPMDDSLAQVAVDFGGRSWLVWNAEFNREKIGNMPTELFMHFFKSFSDTAKCNINITASGVNEHHKIEAVFKAFARATGMAVKRNPDSLSSPSTK
ncbi:MAG: bifunctional histidinol-phosphatase/imidazoleglycerol-phosphate dehydratase HisB [Bacteroidetes bacterium]|nr:bifunctional histidinol-phosphatase/imidazoleglycerol-phosphate dehydratase HisB [Bacteroidota bacterium]